MPGRCETLVTHVYGHKVLEWSVGKWELSTSTNTHLHKHAHRPAYTSGHLHMPTWVANMFMRFPFGGQRNSIMLSRFGFRNPFPLSNVKLWIFAHPQGVVSAGGEQEKREVEVGRGRVVTPIAKWRQRYVRKMLNKRLMHNLFEVHKLRGRGSWGYGSDYNPFIANSRERAGRGGRGYNGQRAAD